MIFILGIIAAIVSFGLTYVVRRVMLRFNVVDTPDKGRKQHKKRTPLGGGLAIYITFFAIAGLLYWFFGDQIIDIPARNILILAAGGLIIMIGGFLDDKFDLPPKEQIWFPLAAIAFVMLAGIGPQLLTNPFGGVINLSDWFYAADIIVFFWLATMMYSTKLLDGLDGLVTGIILIGTLIIVALSLQPMWFQPEIALLASIFAGACFGFLLWNYHPAAIFLGEGGSLFLGYMLGAFAILSGSKIATTLVVVAIPVFDMVNVIYRRYKKGNSILAADREHLHFRLLEKGISHRKAVWLLWAIAAAFGVSTLFFQPLGKLFILIILFILMISFSHWLDKNKKSRA